MRVGSLCTGYGGLDMAVLSVLGGELAWVSEYEPPTEKSPNPTQAATRLLAYRHPGVPNHGDLTVMDWSAAEPVDVLTAGWPCQPWSSAGKRKGVEDDRAIWPEVARAVRCLRPRLVVLENVPRIVAAGELARAVGDLASLGYVGSWRCLRASDVGAAHRRERVFVVAADADCEPVGAQSVTESGRCRAPVAGLDHQPAADATGARRGPLQPQHVDHYGGEAVRAGQAEPGRRRGAPADADRAGRLGSRLPGTDVPGQDGPAAGRDDLQHGVAAHAKGITGRICDGERLPHGFGRDEPKWGPYHAAIHRWECILGRPAPAPTVAGRRGGRQLSPWFVEWLMGLPRGWVCEVPGLTRNEMLHLLGNGVLPAQGVAALAWLLGTDVLAGAA
jgi:DNA (cytosine-5)-methyltransferase 1